MEILSEAHRAEQKPDRAATAYNLISTRVEPWIRFSKRANQSFVDHECYVALGHDAASRQAVHQELFRQPLALAALSAVRRQINRSGVLGSDRFQEEIARMLGRRVQPAKPDRSRQTPDAPQAEQIMLL